MDCFHYPLDTETLLRKKRRLRRELLAQNPHPLQKRIAILGGSTTNEVADQLVLFLLQYGIQAEFYQIEYGQYLQDAMFGTPELAEAAVETCGEGKAVLLGNHGLVVWESSLPKAFALARDLEFTAELQWRAMAVGTPNILTDGQMAEALERFKTYGQPKKQDAKNMN